MNLRAFLEQWEPALRAVAAAERKMVDDHYFTPSRLAYEKAVAEKEELSRLIEAETQEVPSGHET